MKRLYGSIVLLIVGLIPGVLMAQAAPLQVVTTTTLIADVARSVGGDLVAVTALVPPGSDAHAFQPAPQDAALIAQADVVLVNGANLEESLLALVESTATVPPVVVSEGVSMLWVGDDAHHEDEPHDDETAAAAHAPGEAGVCEYVAAQIAVLTPEAADDAHEHGICDPHVWMNPLNVQVWAQNIARAFATADPANAATYEANAAAYQEQLAVLDAELAALFEAIPPQNRVLVTSHEFLAYLAARYDFEVVGTVIPSLSTLAEPSPQEVAGLIDLIREAGVSVIFTEVSDSDTLTQVIAQEAGAVMVAPLYSESLSAPDGPASTYLAYMRHNAGVIAGALAGDTLSLTPAHD